MPKPKYQIGDEVWVVFGNKVHKVVVVKIYLPEPKYDQMQYGFARIKEQQTFLERMETDKYITTDGPYAESDLFPTKEELLASL